MAEADVKERFSRLLETLRARICLLDYPPGTRLSEEALASEFGTSRTPLRRVLARLEDEGLVQSQHGVGTIVTDVDLAEMQRTYEFRRELAGLVGRLNPVSVTAEIIETAHDFSLRSLALQTRPNARAFAQLNMDFFLFGTSLTRNEALRDTSERLYFRTARIWLKQVPHLDLGQEVRIFASEIDQIVAALNAGDVLAAALIRQSHISMCVARMTR